MHADKTFFLVSDYKREIIIIALRIRDVQDCKSVLCDVSFCWYMTLRHWVTGFRRFETKYCPHLQGSNVRMEY